jgi:hypothetical protein
MLLQPKNRILVLRRWGSFAAFLMASQFCTCAMAQVAAAEVASTHTFHDPTYKLAFDYPANWNFSEKDGEISTFHLDARSAAGTTAMRAVVSMSENPLPASTFSGAYFYFSVTPRSSAASCGDQAASPAAKKQTPVEKIQIAGLTFAHGHDEQKDICITQRDEVYTAVRRGACYRFDLAVNNFCGGDVSGVKDITPAELDQIRARLQAILSTVRFDPK